MLPGRSVVLLRLAARAGRLLGRKHLDDADGGENHRYDRQEYDCFVEG